MADEQLDEGADITREELTRRGGTAPPIVEESVAIPLDPRIAADVLAGDGAEERVTRTNVTA